MKDYVRTSAKPLPMWPWRGSCRSCRYRSTDWARTVEQLQQALHATTVTLSDDTMSCLDEIWPGPGGEAPQAYAW